MKTLLQDKRSIFNPFLYIAGEKALLLGFLFMALSAFIGSINNYWQDGLIDLHYGPEGPFWLHLAIVTSNWLILLLVLSPLAWRLSSSRIRFIDLAGTLALARFPMSIAVLTGFSDKPLKMAQYFMYAYLGEGVPVELTAADFVITIVLLIIIILMTVWIVALSYNAYKISANIKGNKAGISFAAGIFVAFILAEFMATWLIKTIL